MWDTGSSLSSLYTFPSLDCRLASDTWMNMWQRQDCHGFFHHFHNTWMRESSSCYAAMLFPKVETAWNDPLRRLVKSELQIGRWIFKTIPWGVSKYFPAKNSSDLSSDVGRSWCAGLAKWWSNACSSWSTSLDFARRTSPSERWRVSSHRP